jgi:GntR family transcriptional regulator of arabinose operon
MANFSKMPKYQIVKDYVRHLIRDGLIIYGQQLPSEHDMMVKFGVSRQTVRQAFSELCAEALVYKEQGKGTFCGYRNIRPRQIVAVITTYISDYVFPGIISGIEQVLSDQGYMMLLCNTGNSKESEAQHLTSMLEHDVAGIIIEPTRSAHPNTNRELLEELRRKGTKFVYLNACYNDFDSAHAVMDDREGGRMLADHLLALGHRRLAGVFKTDDKQGVMRKTGFLAAIEACAGAKAVSVGEYETMNMYDYPFTFSQNLLRSSDAPSAIVCYNDQCALQVLQAAAERGLKVPQDISVVGYDNSPIAQIGLKLTTIRHPMKDMGRTAARFMVDMLEGRADSPCRVYRPELVVRDSCRPRPDGA